MPISCAPPPTSPPTRRPHRLCPRPTLLLRCGPQLRGRARRPRRPAGAAVPGGDQSDSEALYRDSPFTRAANAVAAEALSELLAERGPARVIEVGAGTGGTTQALLGRLRPGDQYLFTDISPALRHRRQAPLRARRPGARPGAAAGRAGDPASWVRHRRRRQRAARDPRSRGHLGPGRRAAPPGRRTAAGREWRLHVVGRSHLRPDRRHVALRRPRAAPGPCAAAGGDLARLLVEAGFTVEAFAAGTASTAAASGLLVFRRVARVPAWFAKPAARRSRMRPT